MKKGYKIMLIVISALIGLIIIDLISIFIFNRPLFVIQTENNGTNKVYSGILYDTYYCADLEKPQIKSKGAKYSCRQLVIENDLEITKSKNKEITKAYIINDKYEDSYILYYFGLDKAEIEIDNEKYDFADAISKNLLDLDEFMNDIIVTTIYRDGGSKRAESDDFSILKCNTIDGNRDVYLGRSNMTYETDFCKE